MASMSDTAWRSGRMRMTSSLSSSMRYGLLAEPKSETLSGSLTLTGVEMAKEEGFVELGGMLSVEREVSGLGFFRALPDAVVATEGGTAEYSRTEASL